ncbi:MAG TPA: XRE family transcriptional regulator [Ktedonobacteraceae bacterium]|jgi:predicted XRE-type DNA-binding protein
MINDEEEGYFISSDNPFADDGRPNPEERMMRAELLCYIVLEIKRRGLSRHQAASLLGVSLSQIRYLLEARMSKFSLESLLAMVIKLGADVTSFCQPTESQPGQIVISVPQSA